MELFCQLGDDIEIPPPLRDLRIVLAPPLFQAGDLSNGFIKWLSLFNQALIGMIEPCTVVWV